MKATLNTTTQTQKVKKAKVGIDLRLMRMMQELGFQPAEMPIPDGKFHRINDLLDRPRSKNIWYVLHKNGSGCFSHRSRGGYPAKFNFKVDCTFTQKEINQIAKVQVKILAAEACDTRKRNELCIVQSRGFFENAEDPSPDHNYLVREEIKAYGIKQFGPCLVLPVYYYGEMTGMQFIQPNGKKWFTPGTVKNGAYFCIRGNDNTIYIAESYSTAATIYERTGSSVVVTFDYKNLEEVARWIDVTSTNCDLLIWVEKDYLIQGNPGLTEAIAAARSIGAKLAGPAFPTGSNVIHTATSCGKGGAK